MTLEGSWHLSSSSSMVNLVMGSFVRGARQVKGSNTNRLSLNRGWGRVSQGVARTVSL